VDEREPWIDLAGPASVKRLLDALRDAPAPAPSAERTARVMGSFFANIEHWMARAREEPPADERPSDVYPVQSRSPLPPPPVVEAAPALSFEVWAGLSSRLLDAPAEEKAAAAAALGLTLEAWRRLDDAYLRMLSDDLLAGRTERPSIYQACCEAETARRRGVAVEARAPAEASAPAAAPVSARSPGSLKGTADALPLSPQAREALGLWPYRSAPAAGASPAKAHPKTLNTERAPTLGGTLPLGGDAIQTAVASVPFPGAGAHGVVSIPNLKVKEYVSLRAALAALPDMAEETLRRFGVANETVRRALDDHWRAMLAARPDLRAERDAAVEEYARWLRGER